MKFRYKKYAPGILRPVIPIEIIHNNLTVPYEVLVDSGSDLNIFDAQIADILGVKLHSGKLINPFSNSSFDTSISSV